MTHETLSTNAASQASDEEKPDSPYLPHSPIQEQHIDFLLEEEFACNQAFLHFFLKEARTNFIAPLNHPDHTAPLMPCETWSCKAVRSATTSVGETDVLIIYKPAQAHGLRVAILIEDKIRAGFQDDQPERYHIRGVEGQKSEQWDSFFTCLVAPQKYGTGNAGFDTRVSLETIRSFFSAKDHRTQFKAGVFERALKNFHATGVQKLDAAMTTFRAFYAHEAEQCFKPDEVEWDKPRDAWWDDNWFTFTQAEFPAGAKIVYKPKMGSVELCYANADASSLQELLAKCSDADGIAIKPMRKSAAFCTIVKPIDEFSKPEDVRHLVQESFIAVRKLLVFYAANKHLLRVKFGG
jgi:hypothetical protein